MIPSCEYSERPIHAHAPVSDDGEGGMFFQRDARQRLGLCRTVVPAVVASAVALVRAPRFVDPFDRALAGLARRPRGLAVVAARASPRPSDPRETPFSRWRSQPRPPAGRFVFFGLRARARRRLSDEHAR